MTKAKIVEYAPEDATHYVQFTDNCIPTYYKQGYETLWYWDVTYKRWNKSSLGNGYPDLNSLGVIKQKERP